MNILYILLLTFGLLHLIYIAICMIFGGKRAISSSSFTNWPSIEHIVCFKNESKFVAAKIKNCYDIDYPTIHYTFINDNSSDNTLELIQTNLNEQSRVISNDTNLGKNRSQINAVTTSDSELLLFSDANVFLKKDALKNLVTTFDDETGGLTGNVMITTDFEKREFSGNYWEIEKRIKEFQNRFGTVIGFDGGFYCVRRENYNLTRENELSDFETAFLIFEQQKKTRYIPEAKALEQERRTFKSAFKARMRASNRVFWSYYRISKYINRLSPAVLIHFLFHKLTRYVFVITFVLSLPFLIIDIGKRWPILLLLLLIPAIHRIIAENIALFIGGIIALTGKEYRTWSDGK